MKRFLVLSLFAGILIPATLFAQTAEQIIDRMEENQVQDSASMEGSMRIHDRYGDRTITFNSYTRGEEESLIEFTSLDERGQKILRTEDEIYLYFPEAEELIRLQGSALRDSVMGSDMSYEDMTGGKGLRDSYAVELLGEESREGHDCFMIHLTAISRDVPYAAQTLWIDKEDYVYRYIEQYSRSGDLLKTLTITDYIEQDGRIIPSFFHIEDVMRRNTWTEFEISEIEINPDLDDYLFSLEELTW